MTKCEGCGIESSSGMYALSAGKVCSICLNKAVKQYLKQIQLVKDMKKEDNSTGAWWA